MYYALHRHQTIQWNTETNMLDNALYSIIIKTSKGIIFWKNAAHPFSKVPEINGCWIIINADLSCSSRIFWLIILLKHIILFFLSFVTCLYMQRKNNKKVFTSTLNSPPCTTWGFLCPFFFFTICPNKSIISQQLNGWAEDSWGPICVYYFH